MWVYVGLAGKGVRAKGDYRGVNLPATLLERMRALREGTKEKDFCWGRERASQGYLDLKEKHYPRGEGIYPRWATQQPPILIGYPLCCFAPDDVFKLHVTEP
jgi:hypothetical protein